MVDTPPVACPIREVGHLRLARRAASELALSLGFGEDEENAIALIVGELGANVLRHGHGGEILLSSLRQGDRLGLEVLARDDGPGMTDVAQCLLDGFSTGGTLGTGLGVVRDLAHEFDVRSHPGVGTAISVRLWRDGPRRPGTQG